MLNVKEISSMCEPMYIAHVENGVVYPLIAVETMDGCSNDYPDSYSHPIDPEEIIEDYKKPLSELQSLWQYLYEHAPGSVCNRHLLFGENA